MPSMLNGHSMRLHIDQPRCLIGTTGVAVVSGVCVGGSGVGVLVAVGSGITGNRSGTSVGVTAGAVKMSGDGLANWYTVG